MTRTMATPARTGLAGTLALLLLQAPGARARGPIFTGSAAATDASTGAAIDPEPASAESPTPPGAAPARGGGALEDRFEAPLSPDTAGSGVRSDPCFDWTCGGLEVLYRVIVATFATAFVCGLCKVGRDAFCAGPADLLGVEPGELAEGACVGVGVPACAGGTGYAAGAALPVFAPPGVPETQRHEASGLVVAGACAGCALVCAGSYCVTRMRSGSAREPNDDAPRKRAPRSRRRPGSSQPPPAHAPVEVFRDPAFGEAPQRHVARGHKGTAAASIAAAAFAAAPAAVPGHDEPGRPMVRPADPSERLEDAFAY